MHGRRATGRTGSRGCNRPGCPKMRSRSRSIRSDGEADARRARRGARHPLRCTDAGRQAGLDHAAATGRAARRCARARDQSDRMARLTRDVRGAVRAILCDARTPGDRPDWITRLQQAGLPEDALALEINHFYGAFNAIDYVLTAALNELARDHALAATLREEIAGALGDREPAEHGDLLRLPRTHAFMLEVFRRYPVSTSVVRRTGKPIELGGETLPAGT